VNAILEESGKDRRNVAFAITTNRSTVIDSAFRTRARTLEIAPPKEDERARILAEHLPRIFNDDQLTYFGRNRVEMMANLTKDFTGRNLVKLLEQIAATAKISKGRINESMILASIDSTRVAIKKDQAV
jgi:AAA+ superfamily predicted ATPase